MAYLFDLLLPGLGHLLCRAVGPGLLFLAAHLVGVALTLSAASSDLRWLLATGALQLALGLGALVRLRRRQLAPRLGPRRAIVGALLLPLAWCSVALAVSTSLVRPVTIRSGSMSPSVVTGDTVLVQLFGPLLFDLRHGDIVLVAHPRRRGRLLIKRILGLAGDLIEIRRGILHRNGRALAQCELRSLQDHETHRRVIERLEVSAGRPYLVWDLPAVASRPLRVRVGAGQLFLVGDNRDRSGDSRAFGPVRHEAVRGLVRVRVWPVLTNRVDQAPLGARQAAYRKCGGRGRPSRPGASQ